MILLFLDELNFWVSTVYYDTFTYIISFEPYKISEKLKQKLSIS